jgi:hypothetical protein
VNVYQTVQTSGVHWPDPTPVPLYRSLQETPPRSEPRHGVELFEDLETQMSDYSAQYEDVLSEVRKHYVLPTDSLVLNFLTEHRAIPQVLLAAVPQVKACFGADAVFNLRAPLDESGSRTLYAVAMWPGKSQDVRNALTKFDNDWWMAHAGQAAGYLTFTYELV